MKKRDRTALCVFATFALLASALPLNAADLPARLKVGDRVLMLNGSGARTKSLLQLYKAGLYLTQKSNQAAAIVEADAPMAVRIEITSIFVSQESLVEALNEGFENATRGNTTPIQNEINAFRRCLADSIAKGDVFDLVYVPSTGVMVVKNGTQKGVVPGLAFKQALFGVWLSDRPAADDLKKALLGK